MQNSAQTSWNNCLSFIKDNIQPQAYKTWFEPIVYGCLMEQILVKKIEKKTSFTIDFNLFLLQIIRRHFV